MKIKGARRMLFLSVVTFCPVVAVAPLAQAVTTKTELPNLFLDAPRAVQAQARTAEPHAKRSRVVQLNPRLLAPGWGTLQQPGTRLTANLFDDQEHVVVVEQAEVKGSGEFVCFGRVEGVPDSHVILATVGEAMAGTIMMPGQAPFQVQYLGGGLHRVNEVMPLPPGWCSTGRCAPSDPESALGLAGRDSIEPSLLPRVQSEGAAQPHSASLMTPMAANGDTNPPSVVIDFLVLYTPKALAGAGGEAGINALMDFAVAQANFCYAISQVNVRWNIVYKGLINYNESGDVCADAGWLQSNVNSLRNNCGADLAMLITELNITGASGCAYSWGTAFIRSVITRQYLVVHEISHLLGAGHDRLTCQNQPGNCGNVYPYSYGHRFVADGVTYATVMAYTPGILIPYFSNPNVLFHGVPTGVPAGKTNSADNALTINRYATIVAKLRLATNRFEFAKARYPVAENAGAVTLEVLRSGDTHGTATVECVTVSGTATGGADFIATTNLVTFASGEARQSVTFSVLDDDVAEGDETFVVSLRKPQAGSALGLQSSAMVVIQDDEVNFHFTTDKLMVPEGAGLIEIPFQRGGNTSVAASVGYTITEGTAQSGTDFRATAGVLAFAPGDTEKTIQVDILDDSLVEPDETFTITLEQSTKGETVAAASLTITMADNERPGSPEPPFNITSGANGWVGAVALYPDGKLLCAGRFTEVDGESPSSIVRLQPDGSFDPTWPPVHIRSTLTPESDGFISFVSNLVLQPDGKILVGGMFGSVNGALRTSLARLNADGSLDSTFAPTPGPDSEFGGANALVLLPDRKVLIGGAFWTVNGVSRGIVARLNPDGSLDDTFVANPDRTNNGSAAQVLAVQTDGKVLVGMWGVPFEGGNAYLARLGTDGTRDRSFKGNPSGPVCAIAVLPNGQLLIGGIFTSPKPKLARLNPDGTVDQTFKPQPTLNGTVFDLAALPDGRILIAGGFTSVGGTNCNRVARLNPDGSLDRTFDAGLGPNNRVDVLTVQPDGGVVIGGMFTSVNGQPRTYLARLRSDGTRPTFASPTLLANGEVGMKLFGNAGSTYLLESSADLSSWLPVRTNWFTTTSWEWTEPSIPAAAARFYRAHAVKP